jgi:hypothetical protein
MRRYAELAAVWHHPSADAPDVAEARAGRKGAGSGNVERKCVSA